MIDLAVDEEESRVVVAVRGDITLATADELRDALLGNLRKTKSLRVQLVEVKQFDLTGVQLFYSLCRTGKSTGVEVEILLGDAAPRFEKMLRFAGLTPIPCAI